MSSEIVSSEQEAPTNVKVEGSTPPPSSDTWSSSIPSSPAVTKNASEEKMPHVTKKRSHEDMNVDADALNDSSATIVGEPVIKESDSSQPVFSTAMPPPPKSNMPPPSQKPPTSGQQNVDQKDSPSQASSFQTPNPNNADQNREHTSETLSDEAESSSSSSVSGEPQDMIEDFDWDDLEARYHDKVGAMNDAEQSIVNEFNSLVEYFGVWAQTGSQHEVERSFKRLRTQTTLVQKREDELEEKRQHYIKVVEAFKSALQLLGN